MNGAYYTLYFENSSAPVTVFFDRSRSARRCFEVKFKRTDTRVIEIGAMEFGYTFSTDALRFAVTSFNITSAKF